MNCTGYELSSYFFIGLIESSELLELTRPTRSMNEQPGGINKVRLMILKERYPFRQVMLGPKLETQSLVLLLCLLNLVVDRLRVNQFWKGSRSFKESGHFCFDVTAT